MTPDFATDLRRAADAFDAYGYPREVDRSVRARIAARRRGRDRWMIAAAVALMLVAAWIASPRSETSPAAAPAELALEERAPARTPARPPALAPPPTVRPVPVLRDGPDLAPPNFEAPPRRPVVGAPGAEAVSAVADRAADRGREIFERVHDLRARGAFDAAAEVLRAALHEELSPETSERFSYELGSILTYQLVDRVGTCAHWAYHLKRFDSDRYDREIEQAQSDAGCDGSGRRP